MGRIICEICGNEDLIKQDDVFVCQNCGCKYSIDSIRKMITDNKNTSAESPSFSKPKTDDLIELAEKEIASQNYRDAEKFCDQATEIDPKNSQAWILKAKCMLNLVEDITDLDAMTEVRGTYSRAYECADNSRKSIIEKEIARDFQNYEISLLNRCWNAFIHDVNNSDSIFKLSLLFTTMETDFHHFLQRNRINIFNDLHLFNYFDSISQHFDTAYNAFVNLYNNEYAKSNNYGGEAWDCARNIGMMLSYSISTLISSIRKCDLCMGIKDIDTASKLLALIDQAETIIVDIIDKSGYINGGVEHFYSTLFEEPIKPLKDQFSSIWSSKIKDAEEAYINEYWNTHSEEKITIETRIEELKHLITNAKKRSEDIITVQSTIPELIKYNTLKEKKINLERRINSLGFFKKKEKLVLQEELHALYSDYEKAEDEYNKRKKKLDEEKSSLQDLIQKASLEINELEEKLTNPPKRIIKK